MLTLIILVLVLIPSYFLFTTRNVYFRPGIAKLLGTQRALLVQKVIATLIFAFVVIYVLLSVAAR